YQRCQSWLSVPRTKVSIRPGAHDTAPGSPPSTPPSDAQPLQPLLYHLCPRQPSATRAKTSSRPLAQEATAGPDDMPPWSASHANHDDRLNALTTVPAGT